MSKKIEIADSEIDALLKSVERELSLIESQSLAKSKKLSKADEEVEDKKDYQEDVADQQDEDQKVPEDSEIDQSAQQEGELGQEAIGEEGSDYAPLSDQELQEIYSSMPVEELERHFMAIRSVLNDMYGEEAPAEETPAEEAPAEEAPAEEAPDEDAPAEETPAEEAPDEESTAEEAPAEEESKDDEEEMSKSEKLKKEEILQKIAKQEAALSKMAKIIEILAAPQRKSVANLEFIKKSDYEREIPELTKQEITDRLKNINYATLTKSEREAINSYYLNGNEDDKKVVMKIISRGGK